MKLGLATDRKHVFLHTPGIIRLPGTGFCSTTAGVDCSSAGASTPPAGPARPPAQPSPPDPNPREVFVAGGGSEGALPSSAGHPALPSSQQKLLLPAPCLTATLCPAVCRRLLCARVAPP